VTEPRIEVTIGTVAGDRPPPEQLAGRLEQELRRTAGPAVDARRVAAAIEAAIREGRAP
jgi:hypothetical protein